MEHTRLGFEQNIEAIIEAANVLEDAIQELARSKPDIQPGWGSKKGAVLAVINYLEHDYPNVTRSIDRLRHIMLENNRRWVGNGYEGLTNLSIQTRYCGFINRSGNQS